MIKVLYKIWRIIAEELYTQLEIIKARRHKNG